MAEIVSVRPADFLLDEENPRLTQPNGGQRAALRDLATAQNRKLLKLAADIVEHGIDPSTLPMVIRSTEDKGRYIALEGNRRVTALKALENPEGVAGAVDQSVLNGLRDLSKQYQESPVELVNCTLFKTREEAKHWIRLRHTGENEGAGVLKWAYDEQTRFDARSTATPMHTQVLDWLEKNSDLTREERRKVPAASLGRMLGAPPIRSKLGIALDGGALKVVGDTDKVAKALRWIVDRLANGTITTRDIYTKEQRAAFADTIPKSVTVQPSGGDGKPLDSTTVSKSRKARVAKVKRAKEREVLIPSDCVLNVTDIRVREIEDELRTLNFGTHTNSVSVMFRVFLELSVDVYMDAKALPYTDHTPLAKKVEHVLADLLKHKKLSPQQAKPVRKLVQKDSFLGMTIDLLNEYIHNPNFFPAPRDLRAGWNGLQPFFVAMWSK